MPSGFKSDWRYFTDFVSRDALLLLQKRKWDNNELVYEHMLPEDVFRTWDKSQSKHIDKMSGKLTEDNLPSPSLEDYLVTSSTIPPFSDKLMVQHKIDMFSMKIREYANGASLDGRKDIGAMYGKMQLDVSLYVEDGANIMIVQGWMEQPPEAIDREELVSKS